MLNQHVQYWNDTSSERKNVDEFLCGTANVDMLICTVEQDEMLRCRDAEGVQY